MSLPTVQYGRYSITYDDEEKAWNADPKCRRFQKSGKPYAYKFPESVVYVSNTKQGLMADMKKEGGRVTHVRHDEWVVHCDEL